jgi:hypothetical protein
LNLGDRGNAGDCAPHFRRFGGIVSLTFTLVFAGALLSAPRPAVAEPLPSPAKLDGVYLALGPVGALVHVEDDWDGAFGGEMSLWRVREHDLVSGLGVSIGGHKFSEREGGRVWSEVLAAHRLRWGLALGVAAGATAEVDQVTPPRYGAYGSVWVFAGVIPYVRVGTVQSEGTFVDLGVKIALPALRW